MAALSPATLNVPIGGLSRGFPVPLSTATVGHRPPLESSFSVQNPLHPTKLGRRHSMTMLLLLLRILPLIPSRQVWMRMILVRWLSIQHRRRRLSMVVLRRWMGQQVRVMLKVA